MYLATDQFTPPVQFREPIRHRVQTILEQGSGELNEDVLLAADNVFGVFDGATSLVGERYQGGLTGGLLAARIAACEFKTDGQPLLALAETANRKIHSAQFAENVAIRERHKLWSTSMAVVRLGSDRFEYCHSGDAVILLLMNNGEHRLVTPDVDIDSETLQMWKEIPESEGTVIGELLEEQIQKVRAGMNVDYGVLNGEPEAMSFIRYGSEDLAGVSDILLFTDGLYLPREHPGQDHDWKLFADLYRSKGLHGIHDHVRRLQREDPGCKRYPRFKLHDDIAAVAISC